MKTIIIRILSSFIKLLNNFINKLTVKDQMSITSLTYNDSGRFLIYYLNNDKLESHKQALKNLYTTLMNNNRFLEFGSNKVIIVTAVINGEEFSYHHNVLITNNTTFEEYYSTVEDVIITNYDDGYPVDVIPTFKVRIWNMDEFKNRKIKITKNATNNRNKTSTDLRNNSGIKNIPLNRLGFQTIKRSFTSYIKPIKRQNIDQTVKGFATMDIETINYKGNQIPIAISVAYDNSQTKIFLIDNNLFTLQPNTAVDQLWKEFFEFIIEKSGFFKTIFVHNLGSFDGLFLYKALSNYSSVSEGLHPQNVSTIIDDKNKFIQITLTIKDFKIVWKDSYRIFPVSLDNLCKIFGVSGKISKYDPRFNSISLFNDIDLLDMFKEYSIQDSLSLYQALDKAQDIYNRNYSVDITSILSTSTLSLKIFRQQFLGVDIPILKSSEDSFIRRGYFGGCTDYYKAYAKNLHYYDVNSLYPFAMLKPMPLEIIKFHDNMSNIKLEDFFGFCLAEIKTPKNIDRPLLPYKHNGKTIFPTSIWIGVYFSEELKEVIKHGYQIKLIKGYEFSKIDLFTEYVNHFYQIKKHSSGPERWIAKMHLNQIYGIFGRRKDLIETVNVYNKDLPKYFATKIIKTIIEINDEISTILIQNNINHDIISKLNTYFETNISSYYTEVKSNVAIANKSYKKFKKIKLTIINKFFSTCINELHLGRSYLVIIKLEYRKTCQYKTIFPLFCLSWSNHIKFNQLLYTKLINIDLTYVKNIQFLYLPVSLNKKAIHEKLIESFTQNIKIPNTMNINEWGILLKQNNKNIIEYYYRNIDNIYYIKEYKNFRSWIINEVNILKYLEDNNDFNELINFSDYREFNDNSNTFLRKIDNYILHYIDGKLVSKIHIRNLNVPLKN